MDMSQQAGSSRRSPQIMIGYAALGVLILGAAATLLWEHVGQVLVAVGGVALLVAMVLELRVRKQFEASEVSAFREGGTFGGRKSPQTHMEM